MAKSHSTKSRSKIAKALEQTAPLSATRVELHQALDGILRCPTVAKAIMEVLLKTWWAVLAEDSAPQVNLARRLVECLEAWENAPHSGRCI